MNASLFGNHDDTFPALPEARPAQQRERIWAAFVGMLRTLVEGGKSVVLVLQAPELPREMERLIMQSRSGTERIDGVSSEWWQRRSGFVRSRLDALPEDVSVFDPTDIFCAEGRCVAARAGVSFYFDDNHMSVEGARLVARRIIPMLGL